MKKLGVVLGVVCLLGFSKVVFADWPVSILTKVVANPLIADINGDGKNEVLVATLNKQDESRIYVLDGNGKSLPGWPKSIFDDNRNSKVNNSGPAVADFDGDGKLEICFSTGWSGPGKVHLLDYKGEYLPGWPITMPEKGTPYAPVIADIDNDGELEIVVATAYPDTFSAYEFDGSPVKGWPREVHGKGTSVIVADIDNDKKNEIIAWTYKKLYGWDDDGKNLWAPKNVSIIISCVLADINNDGNIEIVAGTNKGKVCVWDAMTLKPIKNWEKPKELGNGNCKISLADLDRDKKIEIIVSFAGRNENGKLSGNGAVHIFKSDGSSFIGWPQELPIRIGDLVLADIDGDSKIDIMGNSRDGNVHIWRSNGKYVDGYPKLLFGRKRSLIVAPALGDVNGDGYLNAIVAYYHRSNKVFLMKFPGVYEPVTIPWPRATYNNTNNRFFKPVIVQLSEVL